MQSSLVARVGRSNSPKKAHQPLNDSKESSLETLKLVTQHTADDADEEDYGDIDDEDDVTLSRETMPPYTRDTVPTQPSAGTTRQSR